MRHEQHGAGECFECRLERLAALEVEMVRRLVEHQKVRAGGNCYGEREPAPLAAREHGDRFLVLVPAGEEELAEQVLRVRAREPRHRLHALQHGAARIELELLLGEVRRFDAVTKMRTPRRCGAASEDRLEQCRFAGAVRADERDVLAALDRERRAAEQYALTDVNGEIVGFDHRSTAARRLQELEAERALTS